MIIQGLIMKEVFATTNWVNFNLPQRLKTGPLKAKIKAADPCKK